MNRIEPHLTSDRPASDNGHAKKPLIETPKDVAEAVDQMHEQFVELRRQLAGVIVGQDEVAEQLLIAMLCKGHCILQGMPGLAKTMLVSTMASLIDLSFRRVQFTPGPDAWRHYRDGSPAGRSHDGKTSVPVRGRAAVRKRNSGG